MDGAIFRNFSIQNGFGFWKPSFDLLYRLALVATIAVIYAPSLRHPPRADHWCFLNDTVSHHEVLDAVESSYSYTRTRQTLPGDTGLYRPVLFGLLAVERALLEGDLKSTQMIGVILHSCVCLLLLSLLRRIETVIRFHRQPQTAPIPAPPTSSFLPYAMTAFFALSPAIVEMVIWSHLHGYLLFVVLMLGSVNLLFRHISGPGAGNLLCANLWGGLILALVSAFTYELGQFYAVVVGFFLAAVVYPRNGGIRALGLVAVFVGVMILYQAANKHDFRLHRGQFTPDNHLPEIERNALKIHTLTHSARFVLYTNVQPFCPSLLRFWASGDRLNVNEVFWLDPILDRCGFRDVGFALLFALFVSFGMVGLWGLLRRGERLPFLIILLFFGTCSVYAALNILGRMNLRPGPDCLCSNSYYSYMGLLFGLTIWCTLMQGLPRIKGYPTTVAWKAMLVGLVALTIHGGIQVRLINSRFSDLMLGMSAPIRAVHKFVQQHRNEQDFSLTIDYRSSDPVPMRYGKPVTDMIFSRWIDPNAKYRIAIRHRAAVVIEVRAPENLAQASQ